MTPARPPDRVSVSAPAKINLFLHVGAKRADGFHDLESLVAFASAGDELICERDDALALTVTGTFGGDLPAGADNLVLKAARLLGERVGTQQRARMILRKELPVASGIGGGSADAAAALRGLAALWGVDVAQEELIALAARLGSDVPVCLASRPAIISGRGERIVPAGELPRFWFLLVNPGVQISTAEVFARFDRSHPPDSPSPKNSSALASSFSTLPQGQGRNLDALVNFLRTTSNDLEAPAREIAPVIGDVLDDIARQPGTLFARMSGSGATCFGIYADVGAARAAAASIQSRHANWWVAATGLEIPHTLKGRGYRRTHKLDIVDE